MTSVLDSVWDAFGTELALLALFCAGFMLFRNAGLQRLIFGPPKFRNFKSKQEKQVSNSTMTQWMVPVKELEANWAAGRADLVLSAWQSLDYFTLEVLKAVVEALVATNKGHDVNSIIQEILAKHENMCSREAMNVAIEALPASLPQLASSVRSSFLKALGKGSKHSGNSPQANPLASLSPEEHAHAMRIITAVNGQQFEEAKKQVFAMKDAGFQVPGHCFVMFARCASESKSNATFLTDLPCSVFSVEAVVALLEHSMKSGDSQLLRDMYQRAEQMTFLHVPGVCEALLRSYAGLGDSRAVEVFDDLVLKGFNPSEGVLTAVVSLCADSRHIQMAEHALAYARRTNVNATLSLYAAMVKVYGHAQLFDKTCDLYDMMQQDGILPDTVVYGSIIKAAVESGRLELARKLFQKSGNPDLLNYMSLIRAAGREKDLPKALALLEELEGAPLAIDATAYNCVLEVCVSSGNRTAATKLLKRMESKGHVDVVSYNTYMKVLFADGARSEIDAVIESMRSRGLKPNAVTYNSLVKYAVIRQDLPGAWTLISQMEAEGTSPDAFTCSILMKGVKHSCSSEVVDKVVDLIQRAKVTPDEVLVNCLLEAYVRLRNIPRLVQILERFKSTGVVPSLHACALLIKAYGHSQRLDRAWGVWKELVNERKVTPNEEVFASMVDACLASGDLENAVVVFREMKHVLSDFSRGPGVFAALIKACVSRKQTKLAVEIYEEMHLVSFACNKVTYNTLIDALVRQGDVDKATAVFRDMSLKGVTPDLISYATLIKGHCARGCLEEGLQLFGLMQRRGISPDAILFNSILDGCAHKQMRTLTEQVLRDMEAANIAPSNFTLSILVKLYGRCNDLDTAFQVVETYPAKYKFKVNVQVYSCLMSACIANGTLARALGVYTKMVEAGCPTDAKMYQTLLSGCLRHGDLDAAARLVRDALAQGPSPPLDRDVADNVLFMIARRGRGADLGIPLLQELEAAGIGVSARVSTAVRKCDAPNQRPQRSTRA